MKYLPEFIAGALAALIMLYGFHTDWWVALMASALVGLVMGAVSR